MIQDEWAGVIKSWCNRVERIDTVGIVARAAWQIRDTCVRGRAERIICR